ncbi:hypothetical protein F5Y16DRAFT_422669 [Xylariaceae sp. FL0255]|nr:hypothetical protein F5Y16DRAFT_422669 [Xylariaceae sp. FL0255]
MRRASARKSRFGCKQCKKSHKKCDEGKPSCGNCVIRHLKCSFVSPYVPPTPQSTAISPASPSLSDKQVNDCPIDNDSAEPVFKLHDFELFYNFKACFPVVDYDQAPPRFSDVIMQQSFAVPYLMHQLLALSAAHLSTQRPRQAPFYRQEATRRQMQALATFNTSITRNSSDECLATFFFSILISHHVLFDAFATRTSFSALLDNLTTSLHICGGVRAVAGSSLDALTSQYRQHTGCEFPMEVVNTLPHTSFDLVFSAKLAGLKRRIEEANVSYAVSNPCFKALELLSDSTTGTPPGPLEHMAIRVVRWMVTVPTEFVELIEQRRPEALIVVAYCAVLIHNARDFWLFNDTGSFIVRSFVEYLGTYWAEWLSWPSKVTSQTLN